MHALVVGAGAVGQVFAHHLARAGAEVTFFAKPRHAEEAAGELTLFPWNGRRPPGSPKAEGRPSPLRSPVRFRAQAVVTSAAEVAALPVDQVVLTVSSTALRAGAWLSELARAAPGATFVSLQPGLGDAELVAELVDPARTVFGLTAFLSYRDPQLGMAYWFPPFSKSEFSGPRAAEVVAMLAAGGLPARQIADARRSWVVPNAVFTGFIAALEVAGWSFRALRRDGRLLDLAARAAREALDIGATACDVPRPRLAASLMRPMVAKLALCIAPLGVPFDLEAYAKLHFTKVGDQTPLAFETYAAAAQRLGLPAAALAELSAAVRAARV